MMTLWPGSYQDREEPFNYDWNAAIEVRLPKLVETLYAMERVAECMRICEPLCRFFRSVRGQMWCCSTIS